ncbi:MAG TPA: lysylphosphatidylglycerol synthase transmembrane domain-containing protein [Bryobacteraceae bacterium]|nr:lysylphosphatidylglycerol synthase transmembrane domain-containing protein [Bryobacteraceae bacterium]
MTKKYVGAGLAIAAILAVVAFAVYRWRTSGFAWHEFATALETVDWSWLAMSIALILATYVGRALRWEVMLRPLVPRTHLWRLFVATAIGFTAVVLFGRAGEPVRPYLIAKKENVPFSGQVAAWVVERMLDLLMMLVIFGVALSQVSHSTVRHGPRIDIILATGGYLAGIVGLASLALLVGLRQFRGTVLHRLMEGLAFLPEPVTVKIGHALRSFGEGMESMRSGARIRLLILYTVLEWALIAAAFGCVFKAFPATHQLGVTDVVMLLGFIAFGSVVQLPGIGGGVQIVTVLVLTELFGVTLEAATGVALVLWIITFVAIVPLGLALAFHEGIQWRNLRHIETDSEDAGAGGQGT